MTVGVLVATFCSAFWNASPSYSKMSSITSINGRMYLLESMAIRISKVADE